MQIRPFIVSLILALPAFAETQLPPNARVAIIGDSITEQKLYSRFIETYLLGCTGRKDIRCFQFGWSGETAQGFSSRLENDLSVFNPTVATTCYGMNDGRYVPYNPSIGASYEKWMRLVLEGLKKVGVTHIVAGSPGAVDTRWFVKSGATADQYNDSLAHSRDIDKKLAAEYHTAFANVHDEMILPSVRQRRQSRSRTCRHTAHSEAKNDRQAGKAGCRSPRQAGPREAYDQSRNLELSHQPHTASTRD